MTRRAVVVAILCCVLALVGVASFVVSPGTSTSQPAEFDRTVAMGLTLEERQLLDNRIVPRAQVAYSQYPYVVGYRGIGLAATAVDDPLVRRQFGYPQVIYVEVAPSELSVDEAGYLVGEHTGEWIPASRAAFVVDSDVRTPSGESPVAFADRERAAAFASSHGGEIVEWADRERFAAPRDDGSIARDRIQGQQNAANETVADAFELLDRPVGATVGEDEPTLRSALENAEPNTTIRLPPGTYEGPVEIDTPVTIAGDDATIEGDGNGTVVRISADNVAISGVSITGVGDSLRGENVSSGADRPEWDRRTEEAYGYSDAAVTADGVDRLLLADIETDTPASGIVLRDTERAVVDGVRVNGTDEWEEGFMGVVAIRTPAVIQGSTFRNGRDGVYTHRSGGITIRNNRFVGGRFGTHLMYTSNALFVDNCASGQVFSGITVMTSPSGNSIADNVIADTDQGISTSGSDSYVGGNLVVDTEQAIRTSARNSLYTENTVVGNTVGFRASSVFPTSVVVRNDVADNDRHVRATTGPLRVWSRDGEGNYWEGAEGLERQYSPTDPVDGRLHRSEAARTLSSAPVVYGLRTLRGSVPGMRGQSVIDAAPRDRPVNPERLETARELSNGVTDLEEVCA